MAGENIPSEGFFKCSNCQEIRDISKLKGSFENQAELNKLVEEREQYIKKLLELDELELEAEADKKSTEKIQQSQENYRNLLKGVWQRINLWGGVIFCVYCWEKANRSAIKRKGDNVSFICAICNNRVEERIRWGHVVNFTERGIKPDIAVKCCKNCWLNEIVPNDKIVYCPHDEGEGYQGFTLRNLYDCRCEAKGKTDKENIR